MEKIRLAGGWRNRLGHTVRIRVCGMREGRRSGRGGSREGMLGRGCNCRGGGGDVNGGKVSLPSFVFAALPFPFGLREFSGGYSRSWWHCGRRG